MLSKNLAIIKYQQNVMTKLRCLANLSFIW